MHILLKRKEKSLSGPDRRILRELQDTFPVSWRPYADIAGKFGLSEEALLRKVKAWKRAKILRYVGAIFDNKRLGIRSTLVAMKVPARSLARVAAIVNSYPQVSHNYLRRSEYNLWFTLSAPSSGALHGLIRQIRKKTAIKDLLNLETVKVFKIDARFKL